MWMWRKVLHMKWTDKITNQRVLQQGEEVRNLVGLVKIKEIMKTWVGHVDLLRSELAETYYKESHKKDTRIINKRKKQNWDAV